MVEWRASVWATLGVTPQAGQAGDKRVPHRMEVDDAPSLVADGDARGREVGGNDLVHLVGQARPDVLTPRGVARMVSRSASAMSASRAASVAAFAASFAACCAVVRERSAPT